MTKRSDEGTILFAMTLLTLVISGMAVAFYQTVGDNTAFVKRDASSLYALHLAEAGIDTSIDRLNRGLSGEIDPPTAFGRGVFSVEDTSGGPARRVLRSLGNVGGVDRWVEVVVEDQPGFTRADVPAAVSAGSFVYLVGVLGDVDVDGRDHNVAGDQVVGLGCFGVSCGSGVYTLGNSRIGGFGTAPLSGPTQDLGVYDDLVSYGDGADNDNDSRIDEELFNGIDDDGDGKIDEDLVGNPADPDSFLGLEGGTLKEAAIRGGTYFVSAGQFNAHVADPNSGWDNGGQIVYLEFNNLSPANLGASLNTIPSILVHHSGTLASLEDLSGRFKGLILADSIWHADGGVQVIGSIHTTSYQVWISNTGGSLIEILFSSAVLGNLPEPSLTGNYQVVSWREISEAMAAP